MSLNGLLNQTLTLAYKTGFDAYGRETVDSGVQVRCRFQKQTKQRLLPNGSLIVIDAVCYIGAGDNINIGDKVTVDSVDYKVYGKYQAIDGEGRTNHYKLELTKWLTK